MAVKSAKVIFNSIHLFKYWFLVVDEWFIGRELAMNENEIMDYEDFLLNIQDIAIEHNAWNDNTAIAIPTIVRDQTQNRNNELNLLVLLYDYKEEDSDNPEITLPHAGIQLTINGDFIRCDTVPQRQKPFYVGQRFTGLAAGMEDKEREVFITTYYRLLTSEEGPFSQKWSNVSPEVIQDLYELFSTFVPVPFLPIYKQCTPEFLALIGMENWELAVQDFQESPESLALDA